MAQVSRIEIVSCEGDLMTRLSGGNIVADAMLDVADYLRDLTCYRTYFPLKVVLVDTEGRETTICTVSL